MQSAMLELTLESGVADAPPLSPAAASLLASQIESVADAPLPAHARLHEALYGVPIDASSHAGDEKPTAEHRLPARIITGVATDVERTSWRAMYEAGLHELLSVSFLMPSQFTSLLHCLHSRAQQRRRNRQRMARVQAQATQQATKDCPWCLRLVPVMERCRIILRHA